MRAELRRPARNFVPTSGYGNENVIRAVVGPVVRSSVIPRFMRESVPLDACQYGDQ
jgi:hypothetical protein